MENNNTHCRYVDKNGNTMLFSIEDFCTIKSTRWRKNSGGYWVGYSKERKGNIYYTRAVFKNRGIVVKDGLDIDHINNIKDDNRFCNLQILSKSINCWKDEKNKKGYVHKITIVNKSGKKYTYYRGEARRETSVIITKYFKEPKAAKLAIEDILTKNKLC